jgi:hypothetical protein
MRLMKKKKKMRKRWGKQKMGIEGEEEKKKDGGKDG